MDWLVVILGIAIVAEAAFTVQVFSNFRYAMKKYKRPRTFRPRCVVIVPCKGLDTAFEANIQSFYEQAYGGYRLWFVVEDPSDAAYEPLLRLKAQYGQRSAAQDVRILTAGRTSGCSQKLHNLLFAYRQVPPEIEALVFADSDVCAGPEWLCQLIAPLRKSHIGLASGYRWFVPKRNNLASLALSAMNAKVFQLLGNTRFNLAWGGSMAVRKTDFQRLGVEAIWACSLSDDLSLSRAVRRVGMSTRFVPACVVASHITMTWADLWEFARRQFIITRIYSPKMWWFGLVGTLLSVAGLWGGVVLAGWAIATRPTLWWVFFVVGAAFGVFQVCRTALRQELATRLLPKERSAMRAARWADWLGFWAWGILMLAVIIASAGGRTIVWRGIRYRIKGPTKIEVLAKKNNP